MLTGVKAKNSQKGKASIDEALDYSSIYWSLVGSGLDSYLDTKTSPVYIISKEEIRVLLDAAPDFEELHKVVLCSNEGD